jgi:two-component system phosphate regulon response regulator PhoB
MITTDGRPTAGALPLEGNVGRAREGHVNFSAGASFIDENARWARRSPLSRIVVVEDESAIAELIAINLRHAGHEVTLATSAEQARFEIDGELPDLVVLDWMLPGQSGVALARQWRTSERTRDLPIIMLTARGEECDKVMGLEAGADDYLTKPFSTKELIARIRAVLRRRSPQSLDDPLEVAGLRLDPQTHRVSYRGLDLKLGPTEFRLLQFLLSYPERVHTRAQLLDRVWGDHVFIEERTVDVHVKRLRDALAPAKVSWMVDTVRGAGYRLTQHSSSIPL